MNYKITLGITVFATLIISFLFIFFLKSNLPKLNNYSNNKTFDIETSWIEDNVKSFVELSVNTKDGTNGVVRYWNDNFDFFTSSIDGVYSYPDNNYCFWGRTIKSSDKYKNTVGNLTYWKIKMNENLIEEVDFSWNESCGPEIELSNNISLRIKLK
jgi:hypothetical protein